MSAKERGSTRTMLQSYCELPPVQNSLKLRSYFNGARNVLLQAESYLGDDDVQNAYIFLKRFLILAVKIIPSHNAINTTVYTKDRAWLRRERDRVFKVLEMISCRLDEEDAALAREQAAAAKGQTESNQSSARGHGSGASNSGAGASGWWDDLPEVPVGRPPATKTATARGPSDTSAKPLPPVPPLRPAKPPSYQDSMVGVGGGRGAVLPSAPPALEEYEENLPSAPPGPSAPPASEGGGGGYANFEEGQGGEGWGSRGSSVRGAGGGMALADAFSTLKMDQDDPTGGCYPQVGMPRDQQGRASIRPRRNAIGAKRRMVLPSQLFEVFERIARPNTNREPYGIETCGILAGKVVHDVLEMTTLIIPKQEGTSDSCSTTDETELFNCMLSKKLITLGWIHTHPMQQCFLSSVDLHTHCGYQLMLPEAVAVVYAPRDNVKRMGVFRLTQPGGMKLIQECKLKGFHMHPDDVVIYEDADAHLDWVQGKHMSVADLR